MKALRRLLVALCAILATAGSREAAAAAPTEVVIRARLGFDAPEIDGTAEIRWRNPETSPATTLPLFVFANRLRSFAPQNGLAAQMSVAGADYAAADTQILAIESGGASLDWSFEDPRQTIASVTLPRAVAAGEEIVVEVRFRTRLPNLLDVFGASDGLVVGDGGWYPVPLASLGSPPRLWATLTMPAGSTLLLDGQKFTGEQAELAAAEGADRLSFVLSRAPLETETVRAAQHAARIETVPSSEWRHRISPNEEAGDVLRDSLRAILAASTDPKEKVVVRLPLRWYPSATASGMVLVSDRLFEIFPLLRPLHQRELAYAVFLEEERRAAAGREPAADRDWVAEGMAWRRAEALYAARFREGREVRDWIGLLGVFAIVDRFDTAPRIPFLRPFFPTSANDDPLGIRPESARGARPPGRFLFDKLEAKLGPTAFEALLQGYPKGKEPLRELLARAGGKPVTDLVDAWLAPYVPVNYALEDVRRSDRGAVFTIRRDSCEPRPDAIEVAIEQGDRVETTRVDLGGETTKVERSTSRPVTSLVLDPGRKTIQTRLDDDRDPQRFQLLLDSADVEVSSTEFGISTLLVGRRRYDYRKDLAMAAFYTSRGYGIDAGFQLHGGSALDASVFQHNLFAYYAIQELDRDFASDDLPASERRRGRLAGFGLRFNSYDASYFENPAGSYHLKAFFDGYDRALGGDFGFVRGGASLAATLPVGYSTVLAGQVLNGFSASTGGDSIPPQGLYSLGGFRSIRGIGAEDDLGEDILIFRAELRHLLPMRLDWNLQEIVIARRIQLKAFVDTGRVDDSSRRLYDPSGFAVGVGGGVNLFYDFMGFFPTTFYLDVATRADRSSSMQVLFGVGQPF